MMFTTFSALIGSVIFSATAQSHTHGEFHAGYFKPGTAVSMTHDYDGQTDVGGFETITVALDHAYQEGIFSVEIMADPNLQILSPTTRIEHLIYSGHSAEFPIQFSTTQEGQYSLSLGIVYQAPDGQQSRRITSIPIHIGERPVEKALNSQSKPLRRNKPGLIALPASEVIE